MRIKSVKVKNYRVIKDWSLELNDSMNLLVGPNETGKSTLVEAIHRGLFLKASGANAAIKDMQSSHHSEGLPEVEIGFEVGNQTYNISKKFSNRGTAVLRDGNGNDWRDSHADEKMAELLGVEVVNHSGLKSQWAHLWIWQGDSGSHPTEQTGNQISRMIAQLQKLGGAALLQSPLDQKVSDEFACTKEEWFTNKEEPKKTSPLGIAAKVYNDANNAHEAAKDDFKKLQEAVNGSLAANRDIASSEVQIANFKNDINILNEKLQNVYNLRNLESDQERNANEHKNNYNNIKQLDTQILQIRQRIRELQDAQMPLQQQEQVLETQFSDAEDQVRIKDLALDQAIAFARQARLKNELAVAHVNLYERQIQRDSVFGRLENVRIIRELLGNLEAELAGLPAITSDNVQYLQNLQNQLSNEQTALDSMAAGIEFLSTDQDIRVNGNILEIGDSCLLHEVTDITIGSATRLRVRPGGGINLEQARNRLAGTRVQLQNELDRLGVEDTAIAFRHWTAGDQLKNRMNAEQARLDGLGAGTVEGEYNELEKNLIAAKADLQNRLILVTHWEQPQNLVGSQGLLNESKESLAQALDSEAASLRARNLACNTRDQLRIDLDSHRKNMQSGNDELNNLTGQLEVLVNGHQDDEARAAMLANLYALKMASETALAHTRQELANLQPELLELDSQRLNRALSQQTQAKNNAEMRLAEARGLLRRDGISDPQTVLSVADSRARLA